VLELLRRLDYAKFQIVDQSAVPDQVRPSLSFKRGDCGLFGDELPSGDWKKYAATMRQNAEILFRSGVMRKLPGLSRFAMRGKWIDIHAAKS
jgi:hypothetical protein